MKYKLLTALLIVTLSPNLLFAAQPTNAGLQARVVYLENMVSTLQGQVLDLMSRLDNSDLDYDGFTVAAGDCNDADASIFPGAVEILGDGVDNNCDGIIDNATTGTQVGQQSPDFSLLDTLGGNRGLYDELSKSTGVVLYFTMWSPINDVHVSHMRAEIMPLFPDVSFFLVDFVSGSVIDSRAAQLSNGFADIETLVDVDQAVFNLYQASMGTTVVIDNAGIVHMNEDYKDGTKLTDVLTNIQ